MRLGAVDYLVNSNLSLRCSRSRWTERTSRPSRAWPTASGCIRCSRRSGTITELQCGFCTPGILLTAKALLDENPTPTDAEIREAIAGNLCRCTGYHFIVEAIRAASSRRE